MVLPPSASFRVDFSPSNDQEKHKKYAGFSLFRSAVIYNSVLHKDNRPKGYRHDEKGFL